jgi:hypothetical protein
MKTLKFLQSLGIVALLGFAISGCTRDEDPGPIQQSEDQYDFTEFNRLDMGDALHINVAQGTEFSIIVKGDRRNLEDLVVRRSGSTLEMKFKNGLRFARHRQYATEVTIVMPALAGVNFSGAARAHVSGFEIDDFQVSLSGAADCTLDIQASHVDFDLSGASDLIVTGTGSSMKASLSGASMLSALEFPVDDANIDASGASNVKVNALQRLTATLSGASDVIYRGTPVMLISTSGASNVNHE